MLIVIIIIKIFGMGMIKYCIYQRFVIGEELNLFCDLVEVLSQILGINPLFLQK